MNYVVVPRNKSDKENKNSTEEKTSYANNQMSQMSGWVKNTGGFVEFPRDNYRYSESLSAMDGFEDSVSRIIADQVDLVSSSSEEMAASTEEISASFEDVSNLSKNITDRIQTVASHTDDQVQAVNEMTNAIDSLFVVSNDLNDTTHRYKL